MLVARLPGKYICLDTNIAKIEKIAAPNVLKTITFLLSYISDIFPIGNWAIAPETAKRKVTIEISKITQFEEFLLEKLRSNGKQILNKIEKEKALNENIEDELKKFLEDNTKIFLEANNAKS